MFLAANALVDFPNSGSTKSEWMPARFTRLNTLKNSLRNSRFAPSLPKGHGILVFFRMEKSVFANPGPMYVFRPRLPSCPRDGVGKTLPQNGTPDMQLKRPLI